jgi:glutaredoxin
MGTLNDQPELTPKDPHAIHIYVSSVSSNPTVKRNQDTIQTLLTSSHIQYQVIDVARREPALQHMRRQTNGRSLPLPLIFIGGHYRGVSYHLQSTHKKQAILTDGFGMFSNWTI